MQSREGVTQASKRLSVCPLAVATYRCHCCEKGHAAAQCQPDDHHGSGRGDHDKGTCFPGVMPRLFGPPVRPRLESAIQCFVARPALPLYSLRLPDSATLPCAPQAPCSSLSLTPRTPRFPLTERGRGLSKSVPTTANLHFLLQTDWHLPSVRCPSLAVALSASLPWGFFSLRPFHLVSCKLPLVSLPLPALPCPACSGTRISDGSKGRRTAASTCIQISTADRFFWGSRSINIQNPYPGVQIQTARYLHPAADRLQRQFDNSLTAGRNTNLPPVPNTHRPSIHPSTIHRPSIGHPQASTEAHCFGSSTSSRNRLDRSVSQRFVQRRRLFLRFETRAPHTASPPVCRCSRTANHSQTRAAKLHWATPRTRPTAPTAQPTAAAPSRPSRPSTGPSHSSLLFAARLLSLSFPPQQA